MHLAIVGVADDHGVLAHVRGEEVAGRGDLALVRHEQPAAREDALQLQPVDRLVPVDPAVDAAAVQVDQAAQQGVVGRRRVTPCIAQHRDGAHAASMTSAKPRPVTHSGPCS